MDAPANNAANPGVPDPADHLDRLTPETSEAAYDALAAYGFARAYVQDKSVADVGRDEVGRGSLVLAEVAESVAGLSASEEAVGLASATHRAPNVSYLKADLPKLPHPDDHFDVVVAFGVLGGLGDPEEFLREARRTLKGDGTLLVSIPDRLYVRETGGSRGMYAVEAGALLGRHFGGVKLYRLGAVAGGFVFPESGGTEGARVESARLSFAAPSIDPGVPKTRTIVAVCGEDGVTEERPYLLLDRDRRVFDECEERAEEAGLVRDEIRRIQATEAQAFQEALKLHRSEISFLRAQVRRSDARISQLEGQAARLRQRIEDMENSATWRVFEPYRQLRARMDARGSGGGDDRRQG